jgi:hypothetical protein
MGRNRRCYFRRQRSNKQRTIDSAAAVMATTVNGRRHCGGSNVPQYWLYPAVENQ